MSLASQVFEYLFDRYPENPVQSFVISQATDEYVVLTDVVLGDIRVPGIVINLEILPSGTRKHHPCFSCESFPCPLIKHDTV